MAADYLPEVYTALRDRFPEVATAQDRLAETIAQSGPLDARTLRLVKLGIAVGAVSEGAVRSNARRALAEGATREEVEQVALLALTTRGFPTVTAAWGWIREVLDGKAD